MLTFLFGRSGSGKTSHIIEQIRNLVAKGERTYLLVPEQQAFISESMLADLPQSATLCFEVVSFTRLCRIVFGEFGGLANSRASSGTRNLMMWQTLREVSPLLREYKNIKKDRSLGTMMLSAIDELHAGGISPEECQRAAEECAAENPALSRKLSDIGAIYAAFQENLSVRLGESAFAAENMLENMVSSLRAHPYFAGSHIFVDSFQSFTAAERRVLEELARTADLTISFCCDADRKLRKQPHTVSVGEEVDHFLRFAAENGIETRTVTPTASPRTKNAALRFLEAGLWNFSLKKGELPTFKSEELSAIETVICNNESEEASLAALMILRALKDGYRFSEIALIARDAESRKGVLDAALEEAGIPYFYSEKTDLSTTAAARLCLSALRCVVYSFRLPDVLTLLKTGLCDVSAEDADLFEDYCYTWSISGSTFTADRWSMHPDGYTTDKLSDRARRILLAANRVREKLIPPLLTLKRRLAAAHGNTTESCRAIYNYLSDVGLHDTLAASAEYELACGRLREAGEALRVYDYLISALTELATVLADAPTTPEELINALEIMLQCTDIGSVPSVGDCVTVGSAATLRVENVKVAILLGLCEGEFPAAYSDSGIFTEGDKEAMERLRIPLSSRERTVSSDELFYVYRAITKPSEHLILSTCASRVSGGACSPSTAFSRIFFLFPELEGKTLRFDLSRVRSIAAAILAGAKEDGEIEEKLSREEEKAEDRSAVSPAIAEQIFSGNLYLSKSSISAFAECPYKYWCRYVLGLREKDVSRISYDNSGTIIHYILEHFIAEHKKEDGSLCPVSDEEVVRTVNRLMNEYIGGIGCALPPSATFTFSRLRDLTLIMVKSILDEFSDSSFKILAQEQRISDREGENVLSPMKIAVREEKDSPMVILGGTIDRVDCFDNGKQRFLRVVDYKTGSHTFDVKKVADGQDLQLPAYLFTATLDENCHIFGDGKPVVPASALFLSAIEKDGEISTSRSGFILNDGTILHATSGQMNKAMLAGISVKNGIATGSAAVSREEITELKQTLRGSIRKTAESILGGEAKRTPSKDACKFCFLKGSCPVACKGK